MRFLRPLRVALPVLLIAAAAVPAVACTIESAFINGKFDGEGRFVVTSALDCCGKALSIESFTCEKLTVEPGVALTASSHGDQTVYAVGNLDPEHRTVHLTRVTTDASVAEAAVAQARSTTKVANAGAGCCAAKGASAASATAASAGAGACAAKDATAMSAGAGACAAKGATVSASAGHCAAKGATVSAGAGACAAKGADAASAGAGHCTAKGATATAAGAGAACSGVAKSADAKSVAAPAANQVVFAVSGMTCGGCASKVQSAVKALEFTQVTNCEVDVAKATAVLTLAEGQKVDSDAVAKAITAAGFPAQPQAVPAEAGEEASKTEEATSTN
ncbi:MAG: heavy-metal-associated domain-containing protein [Candidatus Eiseniibacteriota bacterium]